MNKLIIIIIFTAFFRFGYAQEELNAVVTINADKVQSNNKQVYQTLQKALTEFINQTRWTDKTFLPQERIDCAFNIVINSQSNNKFSASLQVQSTRPVYGSSYQTSLLNINDTNFNFVYNEFDPLLYNPNSFDSNLVSTIVFYTYLILGVDADTFALNGGEPYFKKAKNVVLQAQSRGGDAWQDKTGEQNRFALIENFTASKFSKTHNIYYKYHRNGLDYFASEPKKAKNNIADSVLALKDLYNITVGNYAIRIFLDAKADEIARIFSGGKSTGKELKLKETLQKMAPTQGNKWRKIEL